MLHAAEDVSLPQQRYGQQDIWERPVSFINPPTSQYAVRATGYLGEGRF
ncbi:Uncharacterised protein [Porphyromonas macacae]|uniref:Uncharacterized protein n=1 Tax=Porphyromonas macacae TaxID=28115 RepID=A0A379DIJ8_9PORP|nr:Uncharacterised protein [Porphyromonas macacae]